MKSTRGVMEAGAHPCDPLGEGKGIAPRGVEGVDRFQKQVIFPGPTPIHEPKAEKKAKRRQLFREEWILPGNPRVEFPERRLNGGEVNVEHVPDETPVG